MLLTKPRRDWEVQFDQLKRAYHRMLYVFTVLDESLSIPELRYLLIAIWKSNTDPESLRQRIATGVEQEEIRWQRGRYNITRDGIEHMYNIENGILLRSGQRAPEDDRRKEFDKPGYGDDRRGGSAYDSRLSGSSRDDGDSRAPSRGGSSSDDRRGGGYRDDRGGSGSRGGSSYGDGRGGGSRDDRSGPPRRDDRGSRGGPPRRDDRGGSSYGDRRDGPSRDDRRGPPRRDDRGGRGAPPRRDDRGGADRGYGSPGR